MSVEYHHRFLKQLKKAPAKIKLAFRRRLKLFLVDPQNPLLNDHSLQGELADCRSINVTGNWRAVYTRQEERLIFLKIGTHTELYGR